jgi:hypothetical protein
MLNQVQGTDPGERLNQPELTKQCFVANFPVLDVLDTAMFRDRAVRNAHDACFTATATRNFYKLDSVPRPYAKRFHHSPFLMPEHP